MKNFYLCSPLFFSETMITKNHHRFSKNKSCHTFGIIYLKDRLEGYHNNAEQLTKIFMMILWPKWRTVSWMGVELDRFNNWVELLSVLRSTQLYLHPTHISSLFSVGLGFVLSSLIIQHFNKSLMIWNKIIYICIALYSFLSTFIYRNAKSHLSLIASLQGRHIHQW